jgi:DHA1 family bicyclomycin/chloramphenicol resistance-like MFS transporter
MDFSNKNNIQDFLLISTLVLITILTGVDGFMYLPAFPEMIKYFKVDPNEITFVSRLVLIGLGAGCLFIGSLSDSYGRKKILLYGLLLYVIAGTCATLSTNFNFLKASCFLIGLAKAAPTVICSTIILDKYNMEAANKKLLVLRIFSLPALIAAPTIAGLIASKFGWRFNFATVSIIVIISYFAVYFSIQEDENKKEKKKFSLLKMLHDYKILLTNFNYIGNAIIMVFQSTIMTIFMNNT